MYAGREGSTTCPLPLHQSLFGFFRTDYILPSKVRSASYGNPSNRRYIAPISLIHYSTTIVYVRTRKDSDISVTEVDVPFDP